MPDERYGKCDVCRYCVHDGDDWACILNNKVTLPKSSCGSYRPGCCSNCTHVKCSFSECTCTLHGRQVEDFEVCPDYDPSGVDAMRRSV